MNVSVLLLTFNEERNLPACLQALQWCDDILVVDSGSKDATVEIAQMAGARILSRTFDNFAAQRNFGLEQGAFRHDWVLHLDADEIVTDAFVAELRRVSPPPEIDAYFVPSKLILFGRWLRHAGMYPTYQVRLGHKDRLRFKQVGHGQREALSQERVATFNEPYLHFSFSGGIQNWLEKHVRYARDEAKLIIDIRNGEKKTNVVETGRTGRRRRAKAVAAFLPPVLRPVARFLYVMLWRKGFLDGGAGLAYALMLSVYEGMISIYLYEKDFSATSKKH
jgi:glycosyltransferase involved in cell wall biosynthesis